MTEALLTLAIMLSLATLALVYLVLRRVVTDPAASLRPLLESAEKSHERTERAVREEIARSRDEGGAQARGLREEVNAGLKTVGDSLVRSVGEISNVQKHQLEAFAAQLAKLTEAGQVQARGLREEMLASLKAFNDSVLKQLAAMTDASEKRLEGLRATIDARLKQIQDDNTVKLEQMRVTVDEKLQGTLEKRLGESFKQVSERLEQVHKGLGEMQNLATGVGDLKRVLTNVKARGILGEVQLASLLEQILTPDQYETNVSTRKGSAERVEFAIRLPGPDGARGEPVWLPIDAKFPKEDYERLIDAQERADVEAAESAAAQLEQRIKGCARDICDKYVDPPHTTDFAIMFLPTEGLFAEVLRRAGLVDHVRQKCQVVITGPTTLSAVLSSLRMGFQTLKVQQHSSEVWTLLGVVKTEFAKFSGILEGVQKKLQQASNTIEDAARKSRTIEKKLRGVQELPADGRPALLPGLGVDADLLGEEAESAPLG